MQVTGHWSATDPVRLRAYHEEFALTGEFSADELHQLRALAAQTDGYKSVPWGVIRPRFALWKNDSFSTATDYGTWDDNTDPRDGSPNIEVAAMCMSGATTQDFGEHPYTIAHAWMHAAIIGRICALKGIDTMGLFDASVAPQLQNGPIYNCSTHSERAIQTVNWGVPGAGASSLAASMQYGYFLGSGDPNSRWDLLFLDPAYIIAGVSVATAKASAHWVRTQAHNLKAAGFSDYWGLDGAETP